jgi:hypothetical protein
MWRRARKVTAVDAADPPADAPDAVNTADWKSIWVDLHFKATGTKTCTVQVMFFSPVGVADGEDYSGKFFAQGSIADLEVVGGDGGHKAFEIETHGRIVVFKVTALGSGAELHIMVAGAQQAIKEGA